jgi:DNA-binding XRE family transcriptional regulator
LTWKDSQKLSQYRYMTKASKNRIAQMRNARGMTQQELADLVGAHWITISKLERGITKLTTEWLEKLAPPLGVHPWELLPNPLRTGLAETGWRTDTFAEEAPHLAEEGPYLFGDFGGRWMTVQHDALEPILHRGDQVQLKPLREVASEHLVSLEGRLCFFDGESKYFGFLYTGRRSGTFDLFWFGRRVVQGAKRTQISLVSSIRFQVAG